MRQSIVAIGTLAVGFAAGWLFSPGPFHHWYKSSQEIVLVEVAGGKEQITGRIPKGTLMLADKRLRHHGEVGWWAYFPVLLGTETEAREVVTESSERVTSGTQALVGGPAASFRSGISRSPQ